MSDPVTVTQGDDVRMEPQDALRQLLESEGYALLVQHVRETWGNAAVLRRLKAALAEHPASEHSTLTQSLLGTADAVIHAVNWPEEEYERLRTAGAQPKEPGDRFASHRRTS